MLVKGVHTLLLPLVLAEFPTKENRRKRGQVKKVVRARRGNFVKKRINLKISEHTNPFYS